MDINRGTLDSLFTAFKASLARGFGTATLPVDKLATVVPSGTAIERYPILAMLSQMREWVGPRVVESFMTQLLSVVNRDFEHTIAVNRNDMTDNQMGMYDSLFAQMGQDAENLWGRLLIEALVANGLWLDGAAFFGTTRKYGDNTIANYLTGALTETTFNTVYLAMQSYKGHADQSLNVVPDLLVVGPKNRTVAAGILNQGPGATAANPNAGIVDLLVHPMLVGTYDDYWYLMQTKGVVKGILLQKRQVSTLVRQDQDTDDCVFERNENRYGLHHRGAAALALPHLIHANVL